MPFDPFSFLHFNRWDLHHVLALAIVALIPIALVRARGRKGWKFSRSGTHGTARWAAKKDLTRAGLLGNGGVYVGGWKQGQTVHYLRHNGPENILLYAPPRSGKGVCLIVPTLLSWPHSAVITDLKGELWQLTAGWRQRHGGNKVLRFEPAAGQGSCGFNPLEEVRIGTEYEVGDVQNLATMIVDPEGLGLRDFWQRASQSLITGALLHLLYKGKREGTPATLPVLDALLSDPGRSIEKVWQEMLTYPHLNGQCHPAVAASGRDMLDRVREAGAEASGVLSTAKGFLSLYRDPTVARNVSCSDFRIADLMHHASPVSLYIVTQPNDKTRLKPLVRVLVNQIVRLLAEGITFENGQPKPNYRYRLLLMLDEFPSLGKLEIMQESLAFTPGYGLKAYLVCQDLNQLQAHYGRDEAITSACHVQIAFAPNRLETAEHLSKLAGTTTVVREQVTRQAGGIFGGNVSRTLQESARPLLTPDECRTLPGPRKNAQGMIIEGGEMLIAAAGFPMCRGKQTPYFLDPVFKARAEVPPPAQSDVVLRKPTLRKPNATTARATTDDAPAEVDGLETEVTA
jgi:type IV secretion system protein VirD4